jgi:hypothetical protein
LSRLKLLAAAALTIAVAPAHSAPTFGIAGGIGPAACSYDSSKEPTVGTNCSFSITSKGAASFKGQISNIFTFGAKGDGITDDGPALLSGLSAASKGSVIFPHTQAGYVLNGTAPGITITANGTNYPFPSITLGKFDFGENALSGSMVGSPYQGNGLLNQTYTNPYNVVTGIKYTFDPAALPLKSAGISPNDGGVTNIGMSIECAPNRPNPLSVDSAGTASPNHNWIACLYLGADTGKGGSTGTTINTGVANPVLNIDENSGTNFEFDINSNGTGTKDGGINRGIYIAGGGNPGTNFSQNTVALDIIHSDYIGGYQPYSTGVSIHSSVTNLLLWKDITNEFGYAIQLLDASNGNAQEFIVDKNGYTSATGYRTYPSPFASLATCNNSQEGSQRAVTDSSTQTWGATITGGGSNHVLAYCDGTVWTVMAR